MYKVLAECRQSYNDYDVTGYDRVLQMLSEMPSTPGIQKAMKLAEAGPTLSSPRFAYPHIISALRNE